MDKHQISDALRDMAAKGEAADADTLRLVANELDRQAALIARFVALSSAMDAIRGVGADLARKEAA